ncbi:MULTISPECIES: PAAR domain-containing protein [Morganellaceae]|uniref:PAAR domain-containing protein n=2 Tax=Gammaproteobacteria TaxID=1236 RepID=A0ACD3YD06_9GAMM|nr:MULTISPECIES: PAAR domain-containing protein [Morganellaceae]UNH40865.1 PAAR domain-containing protein [Moellerella wisconsensis]
MAVGYFLRVGDSTTCGSHILTGDNTFQWYGVAGAREGDLVTCGKHSGAYYIIGGVNDVWMENRKHAGCSGIVNLVTNSEVISSPHKQIGDNYGKTNKTAFQC